ncbi:MAG: hypothetical protein QGG84_11685, partial [Rhodospirillales bacterium]|nr:hypothetical protein [Rhodospirillales bacterium]
DVDDWTPPVLQTNALDGTGIDELIQAFDDHRRYLQESNTLIARHEARARFEIEAHLFQNLRNEMMRKLGGAAGLDEAVSDIAHRRSDPQSWSRKRHIGD